MKKPKSGFSVELDGDIVLNKIEEGKNILHPVSDSGL
jgi:hypothetical protein